jgi:hypothetical protein
MSHFQQHSVDFFGWHLLFIFKSHQHSCYCRQNFLVFRTDNLESIQPGTAFWAKPPAPFAPDAIHFPALGLGFAVFMLARLAP